MWKWMIDIWENYLNLIAITDKNFTMWKQPINIKENYDCFIGNTWNYLTMRK